MLQPQKNFRSMILLFIFILLLGSQLYSQTRNEILIPDIPGYLTLKCDLHSHTVFSDGDVWPTVRVEEAWLDGLDAIAITDHIEYLPHIADIPVNHNRSYELALPRAQASGVLLVKGAEITRDMPPGHFNAIFITDANLLDVDGYKDALKAAKDQGAFVFWNHPGWRQPNNVGIWYDEHTDLYNEGLFKGIEIVNGMDYYPEVLQWALDKNLVIFGNSDIHSPITFDYTPGPETHRPVTLVFAKEKTLPALKEAILAGRTAVYSKNIIFGKSEYLLPLFANSISVLNPVTLVLKKPGFVQINNTSEVTFELIRSGESELINCPEKITLKGGKTNIFPVTLKSETTKGKMIAHVKYNVKNLQTADTVPLSVEIKINIDANPGQ